MVIFLDFDGVLNGMNFLDEQAKHRNEENNINLILNEEKGLDRFWASQMDQKNIANFIEVFGKEDIKIVLSTSWRKLKNIKKWNEQFNKIEGWEFEIIDRTPTLESKEEVQTLKGYWRTNPRGLEIKKWIEENNYKGNYLIIDDDDDMLPEQKDFFIQTNTDIGFLKEDYVKKSCLTCRYSKYGETYCFRLMDYAEPKIDLSKGVECKNNIHWKGTELCKEKLELK